MKFKLTKEKFTNVPTQNPNETHSQKKARLKKEQEEKNPPKK